MTDVLTVPTHFGDISELSTGLADRVDEERLILYGPTAYEEGATVGFAVLLVDGSPALEGIGRVTAAVDGGEERAPETRFDIVFDSLQLEGMSEVVYERIVMARQSMVDGEPGTGEVDVSELEAEAPADWEGDAETAVADPEQLAALADETAGFDDGGATVVADVSQLDGGEARPPSEAPVAVDLDAADVDLADASDVDLADAAEVDMAAEVDLAAEVDFASEAPAAMPGVDMADVAPAETAEVDASAVDELPAHDEAVGFDEGEALSFDEGEAVSFDEGEAGGFDEGGEVDLDAVESFSSSMPPAGRDSLGPPPEDPPIAPSPELPPAPAGFQIPPSEGRLVRPTFPPTWHPMASEPPEPSESTGFFLYEANTLPVPELAPRPEIDPSLRVQPAPRPDAAGEASANQPAPEPQGDTGDEPPQIPLPDDDAEIAPAVEPDSFALGDEVEIQEPGDEAPAEAAPDFEGAADFDGGEQLDAADAVDMEMELEVDDSADPPPPPMGDEAAPVAMADALDDDFEGEIAVDAALDEDIAFEEDDRV